VLVHKGNIASSVQVLFEQNASSGDKNAQKNFLSGILFEKDLACAALKGTENNIQNASKTKVEKPGPVLPTTSAPSKTARLKCVVKPALFWPEESCFSPAEANSIRNNRIVKKIKRDTVVCAAQTLYQEGSGIFFNFQARLVDDGTPYKCLIETKRLVCAEYCK
jgi:hypothetical protein